MKALLSFFLKLICSFLFYLSNLLPGLHILWPFPSSSCSYLNVDNQPDGGRFGASVLNPGPSLGCKTIHLCVGTFAEEDPPSFSPKGWAGWPRDLNKAVRSRTLWLPALRHLLRHGSPTWIGVCGFSFCRFQSAPSSLENTLLFFRWFVFLIAFVKLEAQKNPPSSKYLCPIAAVSPKAARLVSVTSCCLYFQVSTQNVWETSCMWMWACSEGEILKLQPSSVG